MVEILDVVAGVLKRFDFALDEGIEFSEIGDEFRRKVKVHLLSLGAVKCAGISGVSWLIDRELLHRRGA